MPLEPHSGSSWFSSSFLVLLHLFGQLFPPLLLVPPPLASSSSCLLLLLPPPGLCHFLSLAYSVCLCPFCLCPFCLCLFSLCVSEHHLHLASSSCLFIFSYLLTYSLLDLLPIDLYGACATLLAAQPPLQPRNPDSRAQPPEYDAFALKGAVCLDLLVLLFLPCAHFIIFFANLFLHSSTASSASCFLRGCAIFSLSYSVGLSVCLSVCLCVVLSSLPLQLLVPAHLLTFMHLLPIHRNGACATLLAAQPY